MGGGGLSTGNPVIIDAFHRLVFHQFLVVLALCLAGSLAWLLLSSSGSPLRIPTFEARPRMFLRNFFGLLWIVDGLLQYQPQMPLGFAGGVLRAGAESSPLWVQNLVESAASIWDRQPIVLAVAVIWVQIGLGVWLLVARRGVASQLAGVASVVWALVIWLVSGFGGILAAGASLVIGQPGASILYAGVGVLLAVPLSWWQRESSLVVARRVLGGFLVAMSAFQAFPGRGMWTGTDGQGEATNPIALMAAEMASVKQPAATTWAVRSFGDLTTHAPLLVNGFFVFAFGLTGVLLFSSSPKRLRTARYLGGAATVIAWVFVENLGLFGGLSTDPNTMVPLFGLLLALTMRAKGSPVEEQVASEDASDRGANGEPLVANRGLPRLALLVSSVVAVSIIALGVVPMTAAWANGSTDPLLAETLNEPPAPVNFASLAFHLHDDQGRPFTQASFRGHVMVLTFLDPVCINECLEIASEFAVTNELLGASSTQVDFVAVAANPTYNSATILRAFNRQQHLESQANWHFLTGKLSELERMWAYYAASTTNAPGGSMAIHSDLTYVINPEGRVRVIVNATPGETGILHDSFSELLARLIRPHLP
jgi:cytochrome oxidase Cu insertion factor (SCO1/SenC/PrrC family)